MLLAALCTGLDALLLSATGAVTPLSFAAGLALGRALFTVPTLLIFSSADGAITATSNLNCLLYASFALLIG